MEFVKIEKVNLVDAVCQQLRDMIVSGKFPEGTKLESENKLAESFSVSRVVIREALQQLRSEKLIVTRQGVGTYVANPTNFMFGENSIDLTEKTYRDFLHFRESVEYSAVALAKTAATDEDFDELDGCVATMKAEGVTRQLFNEMDYNFHLAVVKCAHNIFLENAIRANRQMLMCVFDAMNNLPDAESFTMTSHEELAMLLRKRDVKRIIKSYDEMGKYNIARLSELFKNRE